MGMIMKSFADSREDYYPEYSSYGCNLARQLNLTPMTYGLRKSDGSTYVNTGDKEPTAIFDCSAFDGQFTQEQYDIAVDEMVKHGTMVRVAD